MTPHTMRPPVTHALLTLCLTLGHAKDKKQEHTLSPIEVSSDGHCLTLADGTPFFYLADTAWELFHRTTRQEALLYLDTRAAQGFNVIQAVLLSELDGIGTPTPQGHRPLRDQDVLKPDTMAGPDNDYWDHADYIISEANHRGMRVALLPSWGSYWHDSDILNEHNARAYGRFLGQRYRDCGVLWVLGGNRPIEDARHMQVQRNLAAGLREGGAKQPITFHPSGANGSSTWMQNEAWLTLHMRQNGHTDLYTGRYSRTLDDYHLSPTRPVIDGESTYEDHPIDFQPQHYGYSTAQDVRHAFYWDVMNGACGDAQGTYAMIYTPTEGRAFAVDMRLLRATRIRVWWYDPCTGKAHKGGILVTTHAPHTFVPPQHASGQDWVLVLDDATCHYPTPGSRSVQC